MLKFIIPVRHHAGVSDWGVVVRNLEATLKSVSAQTSPDWRCLVVANAGAVLPAMPDKCEILWVDAPYAPLPSREGDRDTYESAVRADKGMRLWAGLNHLPAGGFVMITDYDDWVHRDLAATVAADPLNPSGWYAEEGYLYTEGGGILKKRGEFHTVCGTSSIVLDSLLRYPPSGESLEVHIQRRLGSHVNIVADAMRWGIPMKPLPFPGAVYRVGYAQQVSGYRGAWKAVLANLRPGRFIATLTSITPITRQIRRDFWGEA